MSSSESVTTSALVAAALADPATHRQIELDFIRHVEQLLNDDRLRVDTTSGRRPVAQMLKFEHRSNQSEALHRQMMSMRIPDRDLKHQMPVGECLEVNLLKRKLIVFRQVVGRLKVLCVSPTRALLAGESPQPLKPAEVSKILSDIPASAGGVPSTIVLMSTSGFTIEAHELAERRADRTVVMAEPNKAGGWAVYGPVETKALVDLFDPEAEASKRDRVREEIDASTGELSGAGISTEKISTLTQLPLQMVELELKNYAKAHPGLVAKRLDGRVVLFREGSVPPAATSASGGGEMPLIDRVKTLFARKGENEKKIAYLSERRTALMQQRDRSYDDINGLEKQEVKLRGEFKEAPSDIIKRRVTGQLLQLRKDIERRQQLLSVLNQQINIVSTHLHNLELVHQGQSAKLPDSEEVASDAAKAEEMLAGLEADAELVGGFSTVTNTGMSAEEQALYDELEREHAAPAASQTSTAASSATTPDLRTSESTQSTSSRRAEPEAG